MVFSSSVFLFVFLPLVLTGYFLLRPALSNAFLLIASLFFYSWGEAPWVMLLSIALNYGMGWWVQWRCDKGTDARPLVSLTIAANLSLIIVFKYGRFFMGNLNEGLELVHVRPIRQLNLALPLGISFFTFHAMSYVVDIYRRQARAMRNPFDLALYIAFFPQLIAGPIIRYHEIADQYLHRRITVDRFARGVQRFIVGLAKKMLIANIVSVPADAAFAVPLSQLNAGIAWLGIICYSLQIYFDFSGYSDMAIGLGGMFGFEFPENFNYPYIATSITDFWRRWHMTLSRWFRDYLYIPLGGNRLGAPRTYLNLIAVFFFCGLWHGASWTFVIWGLFHGTFLVIERLARRIFPKTEPFGDIRLVANAIGRGYACLVVLIGWVFFRSYNLTHAITFLRAMACLGHGDGKEYNLWLYLNHEVTLIVIIGIVASTPIAASFRRWVSNMDGPRPASHLADRPSPLFWPLLRTAALMCLFMASMAKIFSGTTNPFIYFRF